MSQPRFWGIRQLQGMMLIIVPAAQVNRVAFSAVFRHPHHIHKKAQAFLGFRRQQLHMSQMSDIVDGFFLRHGLFPPFDDSTESMQIIGHLSCEKLFA